MTATTRSSECAALRPLTHVDRCDCCGAQAFVRALFTSGELLFCGHHGRALSPGLLERALCVEDGTAGINA